MNTIITFLTVIFIISLAQWKKSLFLYLMAAPVAIIYGLSLTDGEVQGSARWVAGIVLAIIGTAYIYEVLANVVPSFRKKK